MRRIIRLTCLLLLAGLTADRPVPAQEFARSTADLPPVGPVGVWSRPDGSGVKVYSLGAAVLGIVVPDREGNLANVNLGFGMEPDGLLRYETNPPYFGSICGRYANRIAGAKFTLDGRTYQLTANETTATGGKNQLHGGKRGFDKVWWNIKWLPGRQFLEGVCVCTYTSPDGEEGYPGTVQARVAYTWTGDHELRIEYTATSDKPTPINLTNHCYFNLGGTGDDRTTVLDHELMINADHYLPVNADMIPTGEIAAVEGTVMDFRTPKPIGRDIAAVPPGYDHCYVLNRKGDGLQLAARLRDPKSGRVLEVLTTEPGLQLYTGNHLSGTPETGGFRQYEGVCLEAQHFPDSPNQPQFPNTILRPGETYRQTTVYRFTTDR